MHPKRYRLTTDNFTQVIPIIGQDLRVIDLAKPIEVIVREVKSKRSGQQNRRLHKIIGLCANEAGYTLEEMKQTFKAELLEPLELIKVKGYRIPVYKSTAQMKVGELNEFMEAVESLAAQWFEVRLPYEV